MSKVKKVATLTFGSGINILVNFLFLPYMARVLSYSDYGSYGQTLLIVTFAASLLSFGLPQIIYVYLNQEANTRSVLSSNLLGAFLLSVAGCLILTLSAAFFSNWLNNNSLTRLLSIYSLSLIFTLPYQSINSFLIHQNKVKTSAALAVITNLIKIFLVVAAIQLYNSVELALLGILISQFLQFGIGFFYVKKHLTYTINKPLMVTQLKKGFPLGLTGILGAGILYIDGFMVSKFEGIEAYAIYRNGAIEVPFISTIYTSIAAIILPEVSKLFKQNKLNEIITLKRKVIMNTMMLTYPILVFLLFNASDLIVLYLGEKYEASAIIFAIFNLTLLIRVNDYHDILVAANKSKYILLYYSIIFSLNLVLNYFFINLWGSVGAAYATITSLMVFAFLHLYQSAKIIHTTISTFFNLKHLMLLVLITISIATIVHYGINYFVTEGKIRVMVFATLYFSIVYFSVFKLNLASLTIINQLIPKRFKKQCAE